MLYRTCPDCGANLDPGEKCDCRRDPTPGNRQYQDGARVEREHASACQPTALKQVLR